MFRRAHDESGQAVVEMAIVLLAILMLTAGLVDVGRSIFAYNEVAAAARYGSRWASVVGGTCDTPLGNSTSDWCNQLKKGNIADFWSVAGNAPIQGAGASCPSYGTTPADYYPASTYAGTSSTTIVGAIANHFDTSAQSANLVTGSFSPGLDLSKLEVCIALSGASFTLTPATCAGSPYLPACLPQTGDDATVSVYYPFSPAGGLITTNKSIPLVATAEWQVECCLL